MPNGNQRHWDRYARAFRSTYLFDNHSRRIYDQAYERYNLRSSTRRQRDITYYAARLRAIRDIASARAAFRRYRANRDAARATRPREDGAAVREGVEMGRRHWAGREHLFRRPLQ